MNLILIANYKVTIALSCQGCYKNIRKRTKCKVKKIWCPEKKKTDKNNQQDDKY